MVKKFGLVGIGQCGIAQVSEFHDEFLSYYITSSIEDLQSVGSIKDLHYFHMKNLEGKHGNGSHKEREASKEYLAANYEEILEELSRYLGETEYIFLFASLGGGTGSGSVAFLANLIEEQLHKKVVIVATAPSFSESIQAKTNAYEALQEITQIAQHAVFIVDNNKMSDYAKSNTILAKTITSVITDVSNSKDGVFDQSEICHMLDQKGYAMAMLVKRKQSHIDITPFIKEALRGEGSNKEDNIFMDLESREAYYYMGLKVSATRKTVKIDNDELQNEFGYWKDCFVGYQTKRDVAFVSGMGFPATAIDALYQEIKENNEKIEKDLTKRKTLEFKNDFGIKVEKSAPTPTVTSNVESPLNVLERLKSMSRK